MIGKLDDYLRFNETALNLRGQRQQLIASNIANADTPNYKARDIDFNSAMKSALARSGAATGTAMATAAVQPAELARTSTTHLSAKSGHGGNSGVNGVPLLYRNIQQGAVDGNTVDMDAERNAFADNAIRYEAGITMISGQIKSMLSAIQG
ncbi:flagellar basal body rod protein FlgB [Actimicrobium sp. CCC2.4]|uniref:flagellar basal body rod protein FlgB n=1 Tax=Actimicrobium sp. CCC2.4 TaxID=3048606 RepID=UPI002AC93D0D|nr:flagellar basal body rod protein FlgB [Actimicrobium sp. CCC2.4]MEB0135251.1 flagellar basal body rod protein FlgB [Actimicrobium sp. CCC2.4]WPX31044.1 flagellar basal body rod protein FlgB [Actimicrobium sp. CCC2.4]